MLRMPRMTALPAAVFTIYADSVRQQGLRPLLASTMTALDAQSAATPAPGLTATPAVVVASAPSSAANQSPASDSDPDAQTITVWEAGGFVHCVVNKVFSPEPWPSRIVRRYCSKARGKRFVVASGRDGVFVHVQVKVPTRAIASFARSAVEWIRNKAIRFWDATRNWAAATAWTTLVAALLGHGILASGAPAPGASRDGIKAVVCSVAPLCSGRGAPLPKQ